MRIHTSSALSVLLATAVIGQPVAAGALEEIAESGEIKLAYRSDTPPFSSHGADGQPEGFTIDLCRIIAEDLKERLNLDRLKLTWVKVTADERIDAVASGRAHMECGATTITFSRQEKVDFSNLTYATGASFMAWQGSGIDSIFDLNGKKVAAVAGTTTEGVVRTALEANRVSARVVVVQSHAEALQQLIDGRIDAMAADQATLLGIGYKTQGEDDLQITEDLLSFEPYALPLPRNDADFRLAVNRSLSSLYVRGDVGRSWQKWFGTHDVRPTRMLLMLYRLNSFAE